MRDYLLFPVFILFLSSCGELFDQRPPEPKPGPEGIGNELRDPQKEELTTTEIAKLRNLCQSLEAKKNITLVNLKDKKFVYDMTYTGCNTAFAGRTIKGINTLGSGFEVLGGQSSEFLDIEGHRTGYLGEICRATQDGLSSATLYNMIEIIRSNPPEDTDVFKISFTEDCPGNMPSHTTCIVVDRATFNSGPRNFTVKDRLRAEVHSLQDSQQGLLFYREVTTRPCGTNLVKRETLVDIED